MPSRISITLLICMLGAACAVGALFLPPREVAGPAPAPAPAAADQAGDQTTDVQVSIENFTFTSTGPLRPGQRIVVTNNDSVPHSLTADGGQFDTGLLQPGEQAAILAPAQPGEFSFFCTVHPGMTGSLTVTA